MGRTLAVADIHGDWNIWKKIKEFLQPDDTLYILGDCADRGERGWDIIKEAINHPQVIYLKGNHEDMLADAIREGGEDGVFGRAYYLLAQNGGGVTYNDWVCDGCYTAWARKLDRLPLYEKYVNTAGQTILLSHAGYTPHYPIEEADQDTLIWNREHFWGKWPEGMENTYIVHGHTPCIYLAEDLNIEYEMDNPIWYCDGHKCCIDNCTILNKAALVLDLDTFECHLIK
jgi:serine/threonine protein phosphatase 1